MRLKSLALSMLMCMLFSVPAVSAAVSPAKPSQSGITVQVNGKPLSLSTPVITKNKTTLVPLREVADALKAQVKWNKSASGGNSVTISRGERKATLTLGSATMTANGRSAVLEVAPLANGGVTMVPLRALSEALGTVVSWDGIRKVIRIDDPIQLPIVGTVQKWNELLAQTETFNGYFRRGSEILQLPGNSVNAVDDKATDSAAPASESAAGSSSDYSRTNVQVDGVDEADYAKTDGRFVYQLSGPRVLISDIADPSKPKLASILEYGPDEGFAPQEIYVDDKRLIVIGNNNIYYAYTSAATPSNGSSASDAKMGILPPQPVRSTVGTKIYELDSSGEPKLVRETSLEGGYISSRKIDSALYVITNKYSYNVYPLAKTELNGTASGSSTIEAANSYEPLYSDSSSSVPSGSMKKVALDQIRYFPNSPDGGTLLVGAIDLDRPDQEMQVSAYLGSGQTIYASAKHLYVAIAKYLPDGEQYRQITQVYKFRLDRGSIVYVGEGSVPGTVLNQYGMDEHEGYFRIATTKGDMWANGTATSSNNLYVLDERMATVGALENLAPGERIYSTRFMGGRAYMVTFRNVDPLFAIDLSNPLKPAVLGQLKIPGYSDYLQPYDEDHIIGFGKETVEVPIKGASEDETMAFYQGMKIALFDVSDVGHPKEMFKEVIGDRGTGSELLYNPKALLFSKSKGLLAFPVELMEIKDKQTIEPGGFPAYGQFAYQGAYVYRVDLTNGFDLQGRITHLDSDDLLKSGQNGYDYTKSVRRILYSGDTLYTLSESMLKANALDSLAERGSLRYPALPATPYKEDPGGPAITPMPMLE
ncbi:beta-propeller domain-containing protein [Cohnella lupini]|uniref:Putative secreted protein with C-terminal beta-propeller domain n=1 Tax=Cohnella lupini TaxID=1294267 RepID=A0A3D9HQC8_9BACL|nr:beta-propeller domain-containing protein [Cohnella lupini]RED51724.1 putative secreted protein with C-terminal beta-propeller domain [Cohnella lupini]